MLSLLTAENSGKRSFIVKKVKDYVSRLNSYRKPDDDLEFLPFSIAGRKGLLELEIAFLECPSDGQKHEIASQRSGFSDLDDSFILSAEFKRNEEGKCFVDLVLEVFYKNIVKNGTSRQFFETGFMKLEEEGPTVVVKLDPSFGHAYFTAGAGETRDFVFKDWIPSEGYSVKEASVPTSSSRCIKASTKLVKSLRIYDIDILDQFVSVSHKS